MNAPAIVPPEPEMENDEGTDELLITDGSAVVGVPEFANATLTDTVVPPLLQRLSPNTVNVLAGTVYSVVFVAAASAA
jgi:hypothetical protein